MKKVQSYLSLLRLNYQVSFIEVIVGILFALPISLTLDSILLKTLGLFFCFSLFYGGIYTLNDIVDLKDDKKDAKKTHRPLPSGDISLSSAIVFALFLLLIGSIFAFLVFGSDIAKLFLLFLAINLAYTFFLKRIAFIEIFVNSLTHPLRLILGASVFGAAIPAGFLTAYFFFTVGLAIRIRSLMMENQGVIARPSLRHYTISRIKTLKALSLLMILLLAMTDSKVHVGWYLVLMLFYLVLTVDIPFFAPFAKAFRRVYRGQMTKII